MKFSQLMTSIVAIFTVFGCTQHQYSTSIQQSAKPIEPIEAVGYSSMSQYSSYPIPQQRLMAIRAAKLDAYRNIAEELYGVRIKGNTTVKDLVIESDSYRVYVNGLLRGIHVQTISPKENGIYEAEVILKIDDFKANCLYYPHHACISEVHTVNSYSNNEYQPSPSVNYYSD